MTSNVAKLTPRGSHAELPHLPPGHCIHVGASPYGKRSRRPASRDRAIVDSAPLNRSNIAAINCRLNAKASRRIVAAISLRPARPSRLESDARALVSSLLQGALTKPE
jgi:hypothetical protein